jgi:hypothetical protein
MKHFLAYCKPRRADQAQPEQFSSRRGSGFESGPLDPRLSSSTRDASAGSAPLHRVFSIGEHRIGNLWFGTAEQGTWRYDGESLRRFTEEDGLRARASWPSTRTLGAICGWEARAYASSTEIPSTGSTDTRSVSSDALGRFRPEAEAATHHCAHQHLPARGPSSPPSTSEAGFACGRSLRPLRGR